MAKLIGFVRAVVGEVFAVAADGSKRQLGEGDRVFAGEQLLTGAGGAVAIRLVNGGELTVGRDSSLMLDTQLLAGENARAPIQPATPEHVPSAQELAEVEEVQQAIASGVDPTLSLPATAAGPGTGGPAGSGGGGISFVLLGETGDRVDPNIGYPTGPLQFAPLFPEIFPQGADEVSDPIPSIRVEYFADATGQVLTERGVVDEAALPGGSRAESPAESTFGRVVISSLDGIQAIQVQDKDGNWIDVLDGGVVQGQYGTLQVAPNGTWVFTLNGNTLDHKDPNATTTDEVVQSFPVRVIDADGDISPPASLVINIGDDGPQAINDSVLTPEDTPVTVNVLGNDIQGVDSGATLVSAVLTGGSGTVSFLPDGSVTFTPTPGFEGLASISYVMQDADGDTSQAVLTVGVGVDSVPDLAITYGPGAGVVDEAALNAGGSGDGLPGSNPSSTAEQTSGSIVVDTKGDSLGSVTISSVVIGGVDVTNGGTVSGQYGVLQVTKNGEGEYSWTYTLTDNTLDHAGVNLTGTEDQLFDVFSVVATDNEGDPAGPQALTIAINDDGPTAVNDSVLTPEDTPVTVNVLGNDVQGSDTATLIGASLTSGNGSVSFLPDGAVTFSPAPGFEGVATIAYTILDADGDTAQAVLTVGVGVDSVPDLAITYGPGAGVVDEEALNAGGSGDGLPGSNPSSTAEQTSGSIVVDTKGDSLGSVTISSVIIGGVDVTNGGAVDGQYGVLQVTKNGEGEYSWTYTLTDNTLDHAGVNLTGTEDQLFDVFSVVATDNEGDPAGPQALTIAINDDGPTAVNDDSSLSEDATSVSGNVLVNDIAGADAGAVVTTPGTSIGSYGQLVLGAGGAYTYTLNTASPVVQGLDTDASLTETFAYTMRDADGDESSATVTITITGSNDVPSLTVDPGNGGANDVVDEAGLSSGSDAASPSEFASGTFTLSDADGLDDLQSVTINGITVAIGSLAGSSFAGASGTLTITAYDAATGVATYTYQLTSPTTDLAGIETDTFTLSVSDGTTPSAPATITIDILDDLPNAEDDVPASLVEDGLSLVEGNVLSNDEHANGQIGADGRFFVAWENSTANILSTYGTVVLGDDGSYRFVLDNTRPATQALNAGEVVSETFTYTIRDADGDTDTAILTLSVTGTADGVVLGGLDGTGSEIVVDDANLADGSAANAALLTQTGSFTFSAPDGVQSLTVGGSPLISGGVLAGTLPTLTSGLGNTLTITGVDYDPATGGGTVFYSYTLLDNEMHTQPANDTALSESFAVELVGSGGSTTSQSLDVTILDDVPNAVSGEPASLVEDGLSLIEGNVLLNDVHTNGQIGADGRFFVAWEDSTANILSTYGTVVLGDDGSYRFVLDNTRPATQALNAGEVVSETFTYTIRDADGDTDTATLTLRVAGADDGVVLSGLNATGGEITVSDANLADGSAANAALLTQTGSFTFNAPDGVQSLTVGGSALISGGVLAGTLPTLTSGLGNTLTITSVSYDPATGSGTVFYSYTLLDNEMHTQPANDTALSESFAVELIDDSGSTTSQSLDVTILDDVPNAVSGEPASLVEDGLSLIEGNVLLNDVHTNGQIGADGRFFVAWEDSTANILSTYGTVVLGDDGSYRFVLDNTRPATQALNAGEVVSETFTYTIRDADGDTDTATLILRVAGADDGAVLSGLNATGGEILVSDANLADGSAANVALLTQTGSFTFSAPDGVQSLTVGGSALISGGVLAGTLPTLTSGLGNTLTITGVSYDPATGSGTVFYSYTLLDNEMHTQPANDTALSESFAVELIDDSGSTTSQNLDVTILDDVPQAFLPEHGMLIDQVAATRTITEDLRFAEAAGADGVGDVVFVPTFGTAEGDAARDGSGHLITLFNPDTGTEEQLYLHYSTDGHTLEAITAGGRVGFTMVLDTATDTYTLTTLGVLSNDTRTVIDALSATGSAGHDNFKALLNVDPVTLQDVLMSSTTGFINSTPEDIGIADQWIDTGDDIRFDFVNGLAVNAASTTGFSYSTHNLIHSFRQSIFQVQGEKGVVNLTLLAIVADNDNVFGATDPDETQVNLSTSDIKVYDALGNTVTPGAASGLSLIDNGNAITINGLQDDWSFEINSATQFSAVQVTGASGSTDFALGTFSYSQVLPSQPIDLAYQIQASDGDGDAILSTLNATLYPQENTIAGGTGDDPLVGTAAADWIFGHDGNDSLSGLLGDDALSGGDGDDRLNGGQGSDLLSGGLGADTFVWSAGDSGIDRITDFTPGEDTLDLSQLLQGETSTVESLTSYLSFTFGASTTITVDANGANAGPVPPQSIILEGVDLSVAYNSPDAAGVIAGMLGDGTLKVDTV